MKMEIQPLIIVLAMGLIVTNGYTEGTDSPGVTLEFHDKAEYVGYNTVLGEDLPQFIYLKPKKYNVPKYPSQDLSAKMEGSLMVNVVVKEDGEVESFIFTQIKATGPMTQEVGKVVRSWVFPKISQKGKYVKYVASLPVVFHLKSPEGLPNQAAQSTTSSVTPPAGQEARQP